MEACWDLVAAAAVASAVVAAAPVVFPVPVPAFDVSELATTSLQEVQNASVLGMEIPHVSHVSRMSAPAPAPMPMPMQEQEQEQETMRTPEMSINLVVLTS
jgi:hypothetical protein